MPGCQRLARLVKVRPATACRFSSMSYAGRPVSSARSCRAQAASGGGDQAEQVLLGLAAAQQPLELALHVGPDHLRPARRVQHPDDGRIAQRMIIGDVRRDRRVGPPGHDDPQPGRRPGW